MKQHDWYQMRFKLSSCFCAAILATVLIALLLSLCAGWLWHSLQEDIAQQKEREIKFLQGLVVQAQNSHGVVNIYSFLGPNDPHFWYVEALEPLRNQDRIHRLIFEEYPHDLNKNSMEIIASMPDLQEIYIDIVCRHLEGPLFEPLAELPELRILILRRFLLEEDGYKSLLDVKNLRVLALLRPLKIVGQHEYGYDKFAPHPKVELEKIVNILSSATHLEYLFLDSAFGDWQDELNEKLPNTEVFIDPTNPDDPSFGAFHDIFERIESLRGSWPVESSPNEEEQPKAEPVQIETQ